ncbi:MAG TPA: transglutaminaseTgpA domain-containing protein [Acidimicrobiales bacterium]|nr:transglutaminaseTgpA domain-containing protein [Acidimicrobiales bacterium]
MTALPPSATVGPSKTVPPQVTERAPAIAPDFWLLAVSLAAGLGTARLTQAPSAAHVVGPIIATVVAGHIGASLARRLRVSGGGVVVAGVLSVALATVWGQLFSATSHGIPTATTWRVLASKFDAAGTVIRSHPTPVPATPGVVLCIATGAGLVAVMARSLWARQEARNAGPLVVLVPSFGMFCYTSLLSSQVDRLPGVISYVGCCLLFVTVADRATRIGVVSRRVASGVMAGVPAVVAVALAIIVPLAASPALATLKVDALPFPPPPGANKGLGLATGSPNDGGVGTGGVTSASPGASGVRAIDLVDNLKAVLVNRTTETMFAAQSSLPTYWQVAVLTDFDGTAWIPDPTTEAAAQSFALSPQSKEVAGLPALPEPTATPTFRARITIGDLESTLLPLPPTTYSVDTDADLVPGFGAVEPVEAAPGLAYTASARVPVNPTTATKATTMSPQVVSATELAPYLQLPTEPPDVVALAHQIVASAKGPAGEAAALARFFNGGRFHYTLSPPTTSGPDALESFLFSTKAGFCQQFAAAYGVLARIDGLPTRVAVGFTTGDSQGRQRYLITGADAHVWPEVYLGPTTGWTSYEPTPASSGEATGVGVNSGSKSSAQSSGARSPATTASTVASLRHPFSANVTVPSTLPESVRATAAATATPRGSSGVAVAIAGVVVGVVGVVALGGVWVRRRMRNGWDPLGARRDRRRRRRRRPAPDPSAEVIAQWRDAVSVLERARLGRRPAETLHEHAARLQSLAGAKWLTPYRPMSHEPTDVTIDAGIEAYATLAELADRASYGSGHCSAADAADAEKLGGVVRAGLAGAGGRRGVLVGS